MSSLPSSAGSGSGSLPKTKMNLRSTAVKRIMQEASELADPSEDDFIAAPLENDIFEWHCTMRGVKDSEYEGGLYHLRILLPPTYPMSAPDIILLTPNGRFELGKKICIDGLTSFHAGSWQPAWGVRTAVLGLRSFWMQGGEAMSAIGALDYSKEERRRLAKSSHEWECPDCGKMKDQIPERSTDHHHAPKSTELPRTDVPTLQAGSVSSPSPAAAQAGGDGSTSLADKTESAGSSPDAITASQPTSVPVAPAAAPQIAMPAPTPTPTMPAPPSQRRQAPIWIDALIIAGMAVLVTLLYRKISNPSNLIETVSL